MSRAPALPRPDAAALAHSERLVRLIDERIAAGPLPFVDYMDLALYAPGLGYYSAGAAKFGAAGDFVTAPELSPLFGRCVAAQCAEVFDALGSSPAVLELGAGSGRLAASVLEALDGREVDYLILETGAELRERQRTLLGACLPPAAFDRVRWLDTLPTGFRGVVLANEVMDALPVERFVKAGGRTLQVRTVRAKGDEGARGGERGGDGGGEGIAFGDATGAAPGALGAAVEAIEADLGRTLEDGYAGELCPSLGAWVAALGEALERGVVLLADYGYPRRELYLAERRGGTLACHYRHRVHGDPYLWPGLQDITAHVDFTAVAEAGTGAGLELLGYATQSMFLLGCGLEAELVAARAALEREPDRITLARTVRTLTLPGEMGERFQFVAFGKDYARPLRGFALQDLTHRL